MLGCLAQALLSELAAAEEAQAAGEAEARTLRSRLSVAALAAAAEGEVSAALRADLDRERARLKREFCAVHSALADEQASACALQFEMAAASQVCGLPRLPACVRAHRKNFGSQLSRLRRLELPRGAFRSVQRWRLALIMPCDAMRSPSQLKITHDERRGCVP